MSISASLLAFGVRYVFDVSIENVVHVIETRLTDHSQALPRALAKANDRAWQAVGLAFAGDGLFEWIKDAFRDGDLKGIRNQIKSFLDNTPTGLESANADLRINATREWHQLRKAKRLAAESISPALLASRAASLERYSSPAQLAQAAHRAVADTAIALQQEAPHLAVLLTTAPPNGTPLLAAAFTFFFRREVETNTELSHGLTFDFLRQISDRQEHGFMQLEFSLGAHIGPVLARLDSLFDLLGDSIASNDAKMTEIRHMFEQLIKLRDVPTSTSDPLKVSVTNKAELETLRKMRDVLRALPAELVTSTDWGKLGDLLAAAGLFDQAKQAHEASALAAKTAADRMAEAEAEYKRFRDTCETAEHATAITAFRRAVELDPERFTPFDLHRYRPLAVLGVGGFGTVFLAEDQYVRVGKDRTPQKVAIKAIHDSACDTMLERDLATTFDEADTLSTLNHAGYRAALDRSLAGTLRYAPPEQRNELDADVGPYSDVYAWGKTCLDLLFRTTEPKSLHWDKLPEEYMGRAQKLFEHATIDDLDYRFPDFEPVLSALEELLKSPAPKYGLVELPSQPPPPPPRKMRELAPELPPPNEPPANPKVRDTFTLRIVAPQYDHKPGEIMIVKIPSALTGPKPGTPIAVKWKPVPPRP